MEAEVTLVLSGDLSDQSLEGQLADEELCRLLELSDLSEGDGAGTEPVRLLDSFVGNVGSLARGFVRQLLAWRLGAGILASGLFGASHWGICFEFVGFKLITNAGHFLLKSQTRR